MSVYKKEDAKSGGWGQVREALQSFEGDVVSIDEGQWGGKLIDDDGNVIPPKTFFEVECANNVPLEVTEELEMDISEAFSFRINMSDYDGSFWVDEFLASADAHKVLLPDGIKGKRVTWKKVTKEWEIKGVKRSYTNYVIAGVADVGAPSTATPATPTPTTEQAPPPPDVDPMAIALELAFDKTEAQFRSAITLHPQLKGSPLLPLAKAGAITAALVKEGKLVEVEGVYKKPS